MLVAIPACGGKCQPVMDITTIQPITGTWIAGATALTIAKHLQLVGMSHLFFSPTLVFHRHQYWRIVTTFFYFGDFNIHTIMYAVTSLRFAYMLEQSNFGSARRAEFAWLLLFSAATLLCLSSVLTIPFLSLPLSQILTYVWCRKNRHQHISLFGFITITAPYLPYAYLVIDILLGSTLNELRGDLVAIAIAHIYLFFTSWWPREYASSGYNPLETPELLKQLLGPNPVV